MIDFKDFKKMTLGDKIKHLRKFHYKTLDEVAKFCETSKSYIWELENNQKANPSFDIVCKLAYCFDVEVELFNNKKTITSKPSLAFYLKNHIASQRCRFKKNEDFARFIGITDEYLDKILKGYEVPKDTGFYYKVSDALNLNYKQHNYLFYCGDLVPPALNGLVESEFNRLIDMSKELLDIKQRFL